MRRTRFHVAALLACASLLFAHVAVAAHACMIAAPMQQPAAGAPCDHGPMGDSNVCASHCDYGDASVDSGHAQFQAPAAVDTGLRVPLLHVALAPRAGVVHPRAAPPPPHSRSTVLRI
jgi:hypothetical protein